MVEVDWISTGSPASKFQLPQPGNAYLSEKVCPRRTCRVFKNEIA